MKASTAFLTTALLATSALAAPEPEAWKDFHHKGGYGKKYSPKKYNDHKKVEYKKHGWGNKKPAHYDEPKCDDKKDEKDYFPFDFTSTYSVTATPDQVVDSNNTYTGGLPGAMGYYDLGINSEYNYICYHIKLVGFRGEYESAADTATHCHEADKGMSGPPRLAFKNPQVNEYDDNERLSVGCLQGPFTTGILDDDGVDLGQNFHVSQIEQDPDAFFVDCHSSLAVPGAVRGQVA